MIIILLSAMPVLAVLASHVAAPVTVFLTVDFTQIIRDSPSYYKMKSRRNIKNG